jgi:Ca2+-binding RTX toxin-like protein
VQLVLPHGDQRAGLGIDLVVFADGSQVALAELLQTAGLEVDQDPHRGANDIAGEGYLYGGAGDDRLSAIGPGDSSLLAPAHAFRTSALIGGSGRDTLIGSAGGDLLLGNDIVATTHADLPWTVSNLWDLGNQYRGGAGDDSIWATAGSDLFEFALGDGLDRITDALHDSSYRQARAVSGLDWRDAGLAQWLPHLQDPAVQDGGHLAQLLSSADVLRFAAGVEPDAVQVSRVGDDLSFAHSNGLDGVIFEGWFDSPVNQLARVEFASGALWDRAVIDALAEGRVPNRAPTPGEALAPLVVDENAWFSHAVSGRAFEDPDGDPLQLRLESTDGRPLPGWLGFDPDTAVIQGLPGQADVGSLSLRLFASDPSGLEAWQDLYLDVRNVNDAPVVREALADQVLTSGTHWRYAVPDGAFHDQDPGDVLSYSLERPGVGGLPDWLTFDPATGLAQGTAPVHAMGVLGLQLTATDQAGASASQSFELVIQPDLAATVGSDGRDVLRAGPSGGWLQGADGNDWLIGRRGDDVLDGGPGNDLLAGAGGNDLYRFGRGGGSDRIFDMGRHGETNRLGFDSGIEVEQLWFRRSGGDLEVSILGTGDRVRVTAWYLADRARLASFHAADGRVLETAGVAALVDAMAAFQPPAAGETSLPAGYRAALEPVLAAAWQ